MQPNVSMWLSVDAHNNNNNDSSMDMDTGMRTPKYYYSSSASVGHGHRRILNDADEYQPHTTTHDPHYQSPSEAKRARHVHHHLAVVSAPEIPLRQSVHDLPRPQIHGQPQGYPQSSYSQGQPSHYPLLPPLTVSSISPPNSTRPLIGLAPLRSVPRRCRQLGCANTAKIQELCPDHHQQQVQQTNQSQYHMSRPYSSSPMSSSRSPMVRPTLPQVRYEFSIPSMLSTSSSSSSSPLERHHQLSPFSHHHHQQQLQYPQDQSRPILPTLKSVGLDGHVSPLASINTISSPASSTSSYSSYDHGSETSAAPTPTAAGSSSASTTTLSSRAVTAAFASTSSSARVSTPSSSKPATKCRRDHCVNAARRKGLCMEHGGRHFCKMDGCSKCAHRGGFCISHGGGRRCAIANCAKSAQSGGICYSHGGGKRCATDGCTHAARSGGFCIKHGKQQQVQQHSSQYHSQQYDEYEQ